MMRDELLGGLRNALEHGASLEKAIQSFISAGYNPQEVQEAAHGLTTGVSTLLSPVSLVPKEAMQQVAVNVVRQQQPQPPILPNIPETREHEDAEASRAKKILVALLIVFIFLLASLIFTLMFGEQVLQALFP